MFITTPPPMIMKPRTPNVLRILSVAALLLVPSFAHAQSLCYSVKCIMPHWVGGTLVETSEIEWLTDLSGQTYSLDGKTYVKVSSHPMSYPTTARRAATTAGDDGLRYYTLGIQKTHCINRARFVFTFTIYYVRSDILINACFICSKNSLICSGEIF